MAEEKNLSDEEISSRAGFGEPAKNPADEEETPKEESSEEEESESQDTDESSEDEEEESEEAETSAEEEEEESESSEESEEETEEEEEESESAKAKHTVPYSRLKEERQRRQAAEKKAEEAMGGLKELPKMVADAVKSALTEIALKPKGEQKEEAEIRAEELASELGLDSKGLAKILKVAVELASKGKASPELEEKLKELEGLRGIAKEQEMQVKFAKEWNDFLPTFQKRYPNAATELLKQAQELMDELAHSAKHHRHELDYILFKNRKKFDAVMKTAPKSKGGERTHRMGEEEYRPEEGEELTPIEDLTPELMKKREAEDIERAKADRKTRDYSIINPK
jgi:hypothetical protein